MQRLALILFVALAISCEKEDDPDKFTSINDYWTVDTPDGLTTITFRVTQDADEIHIVDRVSVVHNGDDFNSKPIDAEIIIISPKEIESITFVNNSFEIPFFVIRFLAISVNDDFTRMDIENSTFNINGEFREFDMLSATRP